MKCAVLVVEDSRTQAEALCALLEAEYDVTLARSGEEALDRLREQPFALLLTDIVMPGISGYELCRRIKDSPEWSGTPVVLLTSLVDPMDIVRGLEAGADNYITKPYEPEHLLARIGHVLGNRRLRRTAKASMGVSVHFMGTELTISSEREQILDLLLSSVEDVIRTNRALEESRRELAEAHARLESFANAKGREAEASAERYRTLMQHAGEAILVLDRRGVITEANARASALLGVPAEELPGSTLARFIPPADLDALRDGLAYTLRAGELHAEQTLLNTQGQALTCEVTASRTRVGADELVLAIFRDVTESRAAEARLRARERQLADAQRIARVGSWEWDLGSGVLHVSDEMFRIFGMDSPVGREVMAEEFMARVHPGDIGALREAIDEAVRGSVPLDTEYRVPREDGVTVIHARAATERDGSGRAVRMFGTAQDVTERRRAEARIEESEQRYRSLFEYNHDAIFSLDLHGRFTSANPACSTLSGFDVGELLGTWFNPLIVPEHRELAQRKFDAACDGTSGTYQVAITSRDGRRLELSVTNTPIRVAGELVGVFGIAKDMTERVRAQEALRRSEEMLRAVVDASPVGIIVLAPDGTVLDWSRAASEIFGWTADEVRGAPLPVAAGAEEDFCALRSRVLAGESLLGLERVRLHKDGSQIPISISASPLRGVDGGILAIVGVVMDLSARKATEQALLESQQQLQHAQKMEAVGRLAGGIAHDFNNLLTAIKGSAQMLLLDVPEGDPAREDLVDIDQAVDRATNLTRQLLTFSRKGVVEPRVLDLAAIVSNSAKLLQRMLREDITLTTSLAERSLCIRADAGQVEQVLMNLVVNARDAMPDGGRVMLEARAVEVRRESGQESHEPAPGSYVLLQVSDTGCGMDAEVQDRAFDPFFTTKPQGQGTGLGLSTVYGIVKQSGGFIQMHSRVGEGTTLRIFFPRITGPQPGDAAAAPMPSVEGGTETLLLVEDEAYVRNIVRRALELRGYRVLLASTGEEALRVCQEHDGRVDLLITDVVMPGISGAELAERVRLQRPELRVLFMSGYTDEVISRHGVLDPGVEFIQKPFSPPALVARVREVLGGAVRS